MIFYTIASKVPKVPDVKVSAAGEVHVSAPVEEAGLLGRHPRQLPGLAPVIVVDLLVVGDGKDRSTMPHPVFTINAAFSF